jgi:hypothetical protein
MPEQCQGIYEIKKQSISKRTKETNKFEKLPRIDKYALTPKIQAEENKLFESSYGCT